jgi:hypothetical protein
MAGFSVRSETMKDIILYILIGILLFLILYFGLSFFAHS